MSPIKPHTKEEIVAAIKELAAKLERRPTMIELCAAAKVSPTQVRRLFGTYGRAMQASALAPLLLGNITMEELFQDWVVVARKLGRIPSIYDYDEHSKYSPRPLKDRFGKWETVPVRMLEFGDRRQLWAGLEEVRELAQRRTDEIQKFTGADAGKPPRVRVDAHLLYGDPLVDSPMLTAPTNEMGVMILFGALARQLGFAILKAQAAFPDCEVFQRVEDKRWRWRRIEFEFQSSSFPKHNHDPKGCDLIVCWEHDWEECPVEVIELRKAFSTQQSAISQNKNR